MKFLPRLMISCLSLVATTASLADSVTPKAVIETYADLVHAEFSDALLTAENLQAKVNAFIAQPSELTQ
ncbi:MAG TPA: hypothetical protein PLM98_04225, partial [Thiolinea sp.]|nr:hypothetical protein [Thiolinea sp.]